VNKFYLSLWFFWAIRVTINSVVLGSLLATVITMIIYLTQGSVKMSEEVIGALIQLFIFWFAIVWNLTLLLALFRSTKELFNYCHNGYKLQLLSCPKNSQSEVIADIGYGDLVRVWRKWFMLLIWLVGAEMVIALAFTLLFTSYSGLFEWFSIYVLYGFILLGAYFSFIILGSRCKQIRITKC
jgi:hypothetical protein